MPNYSVLHLLVVYAMLPFITQCDKHLPQHKAVCCIRYHMLPFIRTSDMRSGMLQGLESEVRLCSKCMRTDQLVCLVRICCQLVCLSGCVTQLVLKSFLTGCRFLHHWSSKAGTAAVDEATQAEADLADVVTI